MKNILILFERSDYMREIEAATRGHANVNIRLTRDGALGLHYPPDRIFVLMRGEPRAISQDWETDRAVMEALHGRSGVHVRWERCPRRLIAEIAAYLGKDLGKRPSVETLSC